MRPGLQPAPDLAAERDQYRLAVQGESHWAFVMGLVGMACSCEKTRARQALGKADRMHLMDRLRLTRVSDTQNDPMSEIWLLYHPGYAPGPRSGRLLSLW